MSNVCDEESANDYMIVPCSHIFFYVFQGIVSLGAVDADKHQSLGGQYEIRGFPTIKIFGANKNKPENYQGEYPCLSLHFK